MKNNELNNLKSKLAINAIIKIIITSLISIIIINICIDGIFNDYFANIINNNSHIIYILLVQNKTIIMTIIYFLTIIMITYFVIKKLNNNLIEIIINVNNILNNPDKDILLSNDLVLLQNNLNKIRLDLIKNRNKAKEEENKKNDLIMYMAHDLKTPLTSVIGYLTLLREEKNITKKLQNKYIKIALDKSLRVEELTNQFFEITRYNLHEMTLNKNNIDLSLLFDQLIEEVYPMLQDKKLKIKINKKKNLPFKADGSLLARAFNNIIKNAINYSKENTTIEIDVKEFEKSYKIVFKNKGEKIPKYKLDKIFDKFYRIDDSRTSKTGGAGLGLSITKDIINLHGGSINVKNDDEFIKFIIRLYK